MEIYYLKENRKEYNYHGKLLFEGEYKNGKRNGPGKQYNSSSNLMFEGFYIDNRKVFGKQYNFNGQIICEINNTYGQLKEYNDYGKLIFKEQYLNLERNGYGEEYNGYGGLIFKGIYLNRKRNGEGEEYDNNKLIFKGKYLNDRQWEGKGYDYFNNEIYKLKDGKGLIKKFDEVGKLICEGYYVNGQRNGEGKEYHHNKLIFEGYYKDGE